MNGTGGDIRLDERRGDTEISNSQKLILNAEDLLESNLGCDLFTEGGDKRFGWLLTFASSSWEDQDTHKVFSCVDLYFVCQDGSTFKAKHKFRPYFYVATKNKLEMEVDAYLRRQYEAQIADIEITEKEDLDLKNHLSGLQKSYLKITFDTVQQMMHVKRDLMHTIEGNRTKFDAMEANESILTRKSKHGFQDYIDCIADFREHDVPYHVRFSIDNDVRCGQWYEVSVHSSGVVLERRRDLLQHAEVHVCAFDTEMTKAPLKGPNADCDSIMMISYMVDGQGYLIINREYVGEDIEDLEYSPKPEYKGCFKVTNVKNEEELLRTWFSHMQVIKPSIYVTYSGDSNDWPFMETRAAHHGFNMKNELGFQCDKSKGECRAKFACHMDCFAWAKHDSYLPPGCHGLKGYLKGSIAPISDDDDDDEWFQLDAILQGWILSTITDEVSDLVLSSVSTASTLWTMIHDLFHDNKHARAMKLEHQFRTTVKGSTPMAAYCQELRNIADWLDDVDAPVSEHQLILQMLRGLPDDLQAQTSFLQFQDPMPSFLQVRSALLLLDRQRTPLGEPTARPCWQVGTPAATAAASTAGVAAAVLLTAAVGIGFLAATSAMAPPLDSVVALDADKGVATATGVEVEGVQTAVRDNGHQRTSKVPGTQPTQTLAPGCWAPDPHPPPT
ncbi:unnamed protein product, partial [Cuscuta campestris]